MVEAIESLHHDNIAHTQINSDNIVTLNGQWKLLDFTRTVLQATEEDKRRDFVGLGRLMMLLAERTLMEDTEGFGEQLLGLIYMLQREDCTIQAIKSHPFYVN